MTNKTTTTTGLQVPGLGQAHYYVAGLNRMASAQPSPLTWDSVVTKQQLINIRRKLYAKERKFMY